jgi:galactosylceramidase
MKSLWPAFLAGCMCTLIHAGPARAADETKTILLDGARLGRAFEGVGALSAGASSRMLIDYPEPQRSDILDYLFKPRFGANLHHLKVEIGGDVNSTDGSEPSHARVRGELQQPKREYYERGYEWWLMKEARRRNPQIILEALQWGAPGWIGDGQFYSQDNADFVAAFLRGARDYHDLTLDYVGIWNERDYDTAYIKLLRRTLDRAGLGKTGIDAGEQWQVEKKWMIAEDLRKDPELRAAVAAVNAHSTEQVGHRTPEVLNPWRPGAEDYKLPVWNGEGHAYGGDWFAALDHARFNRAYPVGRITKTITWSLITSYPDYLPAPDSGPMRAKTPWSGHYEVQPPIWIMAHFNQFARPGWRYVATGSLVLKEGKSHRESGSITTLKDPATDDYSIIIETSDFREPVPLRFRLAGKLSPAALAVWRSTFKQDAFLRLDDINPARGEFSLLALPASIYSLTTTRGQTKGTPPHPIPGDTPFPARYANDFEAPAPGGSPRFFLDQHGVFEVTARSDGLGRCLTQVIPQQGIVWRKCQFPHTVLGDIAWRDYQFATDFSLPVAGKVRFWVRLGKLDGMGAEQNAGYGLEFDEQGRWSLKAAAKLLASGKVPALGSGWHRVAVVVRGTEIEATLDQQLLAKIVDAQFQAGVIGLGTDWHRASFDNLEVVLLDPTGKPVSAPRPGILSHEASPETAL